METPRTTPATRRQKGSLYINGDTIYLKYRTTEMKDGIAERVHKTIRLCERKGEFTSWKRGGETHFSSAVEILRDATMLDVMKRMREIEEDENPAPHALEVEAQKSEKTEIGTDMKIVDFWEQRYFPYCEQVLDVTGKPRRKYSTVYGYRQIWKLHLKEHFAQLTLGEYTPAMGKKYLRSLTAKGTMVRTTVKHIRALAASMFQYATDEEIIPVNIWKSVKIPNDAVDSNTTKHYTIEESENLISALVDHVDAQLVMALACFLGLRPSEIAGLRWEDFEQNWLHIRRGVIRGRIDVPKTPESVASLPMIGQVRIPLELWRLKCGNPRSGWVFENRNGGPIDLHNLVNRVIIPTLKAARIPWKGTYAGRRGACTATIEATGGNYAVAKALLRHKSMTTTLSVYKKAITPEAFQTGMKLLEATSKT
jgi:integrase